MNLVFVSTDQYPDSHAAAIRHSILAKGLTELGHTANFLILSPQNWGGKAELNYKGIHFKTLNFYNGENKVLKIYHKLKAIFSATRILKKQVQQRKTDALIIYTIEILPIFFLIKAAHSLKLKVFHERTELPYAIVNNTKKEIFLIHLYLNKLLPRFDGIFLISDKLMGYISRFNIATKKLLTVVDLNFFNTIKPSPYSFPYIGYCGTIGGNKDGVPILIEAFAKISDQFPALKLVLVGNNSNKTVIKDTLVAIEKFGVTNKVIFSGLIEREMMPLILCNAQILVVAKPDNEQNSGNFPIKIGEYLATGVPVVVTGVGEIPLFITDNKSGFIAIPGSVDSFADKMKEALTNPAKSKEIGLEGREIAKKMFDYKQQSAIMADYINEINKKQ